MTTWMVTVRVQVEENRKLTTRETISLLWDGIEELGEDLDGVEGIQVEALERLDDEEED